MVESTTLVGRSTGTAANDILTLIAQPNTGSAGQIHSFALEGDDLIILGFEKISTFAHGVHARGDTPGLHSGRDTFRFVDLDNVTGFGIVVGRLEDFDFSRDSIQIGLKGLRLEDLSSTPNVSIVSYSAAYNHPDSYGQQWLRIETVGGGNILYALEGARIDMTVEAEEQHAHAHDVGDNEQERHFPYINEVPELASLKIVDFIDQVNVVPFGERDVSGRIINDVDKVRSDVIESTISGGALDDLIAAGLNDDFVFADSGNDKVWGGSGHDRIEGDLGNDTIYGGTGNDTLFAGLGNDLIFADAGDDSIKGGGGSDWITSDGLGLDHLDGGAGSYDTISYALVRDGHVVSSLLTNTGNGGVALGDTYTDIENITGTSNSDVLAGDQNRNILRGLAGDDNIKGNGGNDRLSGGAGDDFIDGGPNYDYAVFSGNRSDFQITMDDEEIIVLDEIRSNGFEGLDRLHRVEVLVFDDMNVLATELLDFIG